MTFLLLFLGVFILVHFRHPKDGSLYYSTLDATFAAAVVLIVIGVNN